ncbi:unnamed protein product [Cuscuta epithymum]|uniref:R3H domain-containing protein n=1 Tax=Cuscuta epithymum TaxID=186058 RepID=A0AAV0C402_9ASTE|nr:unnamed protein product [Cuscuta epithymum]
MVKDLAYTVKNNLPCKHLILSMEEAFIKFLQDDTSSNGVLELKPMDSYSRHLLHRLADIFGLSHHSEGEGEDRHLVVEQCSETLIPSVLVRDVLQQCGEMVSPLNFDVLSRKHEGADGSSQAENPETKHFTSLDEKEASYLAARQRIFSGDANEAGNATERPKKDLKVARRMIEHALGQKIRQSNNEIIFTALDEQRGREAMDGVIIKEEGGTEMKMDMNNNSVGSLLGEEKSEGGIGKEDLIKEQHMGGVIIKEEGGTEMKMDMNNNSIGSLLGEVKSEGRIWKEDLIKEQHMDGVIIKEEGGTEMKVDMNNNGVGSLLGEVKSEGGIRKDDLIKEQHMGAAKRLFANALGIPRDVNLLKGSVESKQTKVFRVKKEEEEEDTLADCST